MKSILTIGEILVEIMATDRGDGFLEPVTLIGPFPSGAPAIFIDQAARFGQPAAMIGCVGDDDFGRVNLNRLRRDGVDVSGDPHRPRGGDRQRVRALPARRLARLRLQHQAERVGPDRARRRGARRARAQRPPARDGNGAVLARDRRHRPRGGGGDQGARRHDLLRPQPAAGDAAPAGPQRGLRSAVPPLRPLSAERRGADPVHRRAKDEEAAVAEILARRRPGGGPQEGRRRGAYFDAATRRAAGFAVDEIDPTGAGDCFGATFVSCWLRNMPPAECLVYAAAAGALAVTKQGPMEGAATRAEIDAFLAERPARGEPRPALSGPRAPDRRRRRRDVGLHRPSAGHRGGPASGRRRAAGF